MSERPSVLLIATLAETGGAQTYVAELLTGLHRDYDVTVAAHGPGPLVDAAARAGVDYVALNHLRRPLSPVSDLRALLELARLMRRVRPQIVHLNSSKAIIVGAVAASLARVPIRIATIHGWPFKTETGFRRTLYTLLTRLVRPLLTTAVCVAESELRAGVAARAIRPRQGVVIRNGVASVAAKRTGLGAGVVSVTRLRPPKDTETLLAAAERLGAGIRPLTIVGDGPGRVDVEATIARLGLADVVSLAGAVEDVTPFLSAARLFVLSSRSEALPMSILEAMAHGLPVVATDVGGVPEAVEDGRTGFVVPAGDAAALAEAIGTILADDDLARAMGEAGRARTSEWFSLERCLAEHRQLYGRLLAAHRTGPSA